VLRNLKGKCIGLWGLSFKPNTDDIRNAPSLFIVKTLLTQGATLRVYDPKAMKAFKNRFPEENLGLIYCESALEATRGTDALLLLTEWPQFNELDFSTVSSLMNASILLDGRNFFDRKTMTDHGFEYYGIGLKQSQIPSRIAV